MIVIKEQHHKEANWERHENPFYWESPERDHPTPGYRGAESTGGG